MAGLSLTELVSPQEAAALDPRFKMKWCKTSQEESAVQSKLEDLAQELRISNPSPSSNYYKYKADENVNDSKVRVFYSLTQTRAEDGNFSKLNEL